MPFNLLLISSLVNGIICCRVRSVKSKEHIFWLEVHTNGVIRMSHYLVRNSKVGIRLLGSISLSIALGLTFTSAAIAEGAHQQFVNEHSSFFRVFNTETAEARLGYHYEPSHEEKDGIGEFDLNAYFLKGDVPTALNKDFFLRFGGEYENRNYDLKTAPAFAGADSSVTLHKVVLLGGAGLFLSPNLLATGALRPGVYSDLDGGVEFDEFKLYADAKLAWRINPGTQLVVGAAYDEVFDSTPVYPLLGVRILSEDGRLHLSLTLPVEARIGYSFNPNTEVFLRGSITGEEYNAKLGDPGQKVKIHTHEQEVALGLSYWVAEHVNLEIEGGVSSGSEFELKHDQAGQFKGDLKKAPFGEVSLGFAF